MNTDEIFNNRRSVAKKICLSIRENNGQLTNSKYFPEIPYCAGKCSYKFSSANFLRLLVSDNAVIRKCDSRWGSINEIKDNSWSLREHVKPEFLEVWTKLTKAMLMENFCLRIKFPKTNPYQTFCVLA